MNRQEYLNRRADSETQIGSVSLKNSAKQPNPMSKEDFDEIDLRNSIHSIDQRLSVLIGQTQLMFAAQKLPEMISSSAYGH